MIKCKLCRLEWPNATGGKCPTCGALLIREVISRRPNRDTPIGQDDISNLKIELEISTSVEKFLQRI